MATLVENTLGQYINIEGIVCPLLTPDVKKKFPLASMTISQIVDQNTNSSIPNALKATFVNVPVSAGRNDMLSFLGQLTTSAMERQGMGDTLVTTAFGARTIQITAGQVYVSTMGSNRACHWSGSIVITIPDIGQMIAPATTAIVTYMRVREEFQDYLPGTGAMAYQSDSDSDDDDNAESMAELAYLKTKTCGIERQLNDLMTMVGTLVQNQRPVEEVVTSVRTVASNY
jgi:hypothetical protein